MKWITRECPKIDRDHDMLRHGLVVYGALYAWCKTCQAETHNWPPQMA